MEFYDNMTKHNQPEIINNYDGKIILKLPLNLILKNLK